MGRPKPGNGPAGGSKAAAGRRRGPAATVADDFALSESDEEQDEFKARRDKISLSRKRQPVDSDDEEGLDEEVLGLLSDEEDEDEDGDEGEEEDDGDDDDDDVLIEKALEKGGRMAELAKQAKAIGSKLKMHKKEDEDDEDEEEQQDERWGGNKRKYYDTDTAGMEGSDDEEALQEEEEEVMRLEKEKAARLKASDFGLDDDAEEDEGEEEGEDEDEEEEATMGALAQKQKKGQAKVRSNGHAIEVETVTKELGALSAEQREAALLADAPELLALLQDLSDSLKEVRQRIGPVLHEVRAGGLATADGISYLEAKHILLLQYCTHIVFYILLKAEGRPVKDHPVISRLVELRAYLEKIRPIDKRLQYQVDRLIKAAQVAAKQEQPSRKGAQAEAEADGEGDALRFGPRRDQLVAKPGAAKAGADKAGSGAAGAEPSGVYRPPKINPVTMEGDVDRADLSRNESRLLKEARRKASRSELVRELAEEVVGAPRELRTEVPGFDSLAAIKHRQKMEARASQEEDMMTRVPLSKEENKKMKQQQRAGMSGKSMLDDFADEVADIVGMSQAPEAGGKGSRLADLLSRQKVSQKFGAEIPRSTAHGGDEDLPRREALHERRLKYDSVAARHAAARGAGSDEDVPDSEFFGSGGSKRGRSNVGEEDEVYQAAAAAAADRKRAKQEKYATPATLPPVADETTAGVRVISKEIERNRGLTPHRRKDLKNPRKKHRIMFEKAQVRRKGAVQDVRGPTGVYGGEATGVKSRVVKSRKLG